MFEEKACKTFVGKDYICRERFVGKEKITSWESLRMSISKFPGHMRSIKLTFSAECLNFGLKRDSFRKFKPDFVKRKFWWEFRTRPTFDRYVGKDSVAFRVCLRIV